MKSRKIVKLSLCRLVLVVGTLFGLQGYAFGQGNALDEFLGSYKVIATSNEEKHPGAAIIIMRTSDGSGANLKTYGLAFVSTVAHGANPKGDGMVCDDALLIHEGTAITCTKIERNPAGHVTFEETLTVGRADSLYCDALREGLKKKGHGDKIIPQNDAKCSGENKCVCYDINHRGTAGHGPPTQGSGTGRGN